MAAGERTVLFPHWTPEAGVGKDSELRAFVADLSSGGTPEYVGTLRRRTVTLHRFRLPDSDGREVVVKVLPTQSSAELAFGALTRLARILHDGPLGVHAVSPLAFARRLPGFAMPYLAHPTLRELLTREPERLGEVMARAGEVLAGIHQRSRWSPDEGAPVVLARRARAASLGSTAEAAARSEVVHRYVDFHPHNLVLFEDSSLVVIDPPTYDEVSHIHHDIVSFIYKTQKCLVRPPWTRARAGYLIDLCDGIIRFLSSYFTTAGRAITSGDATMLERYLSLYVTLRSRRPRWREDLQHHAVYAPLLREQLRFVLGEISPDGLRGLPARDDAA